MPLKIVRSGPSPFSGSGETRNLCSRGVLFAADVQVDIGEPVEYEIALPAGAEGPLPVNLRCLGKVLRFEHAYSGLEDPNRPFRMVASIERYAFVRPEP